METSKKRPSFFIAEIGVNHEGKLEKALSMVRSAKRGGANAVKFQAYRADTLAAHDSPAYWDLDEEKTSTQFALFKRHEQYNIDFYRPIIELCKEIGIEFMVTLFDDDLVEEFDNYVVRHKISSSDITNYRLIEKIAKTCKPVLLSCGASEFDEIRRALDLILKYTTDITLLHCVLNYPCSEKNANISVITQLDKQFGDDAKIGYSCHVKCPEGIEACVTASILGANTIEKHFTYDKTIRGNDHYHAMDESDLVAFRQKEGMIIDLLGSGFPDLRTQESARENARRGLYARRRIERGQIICSDDLIALRPCIEISADRIWQIEGAIATRDIAVNDSIKIGDFDLD